MCTSDSNSNPRVMAATDSWSNRHADLGGPVALAIFRYCHSTAASPPLKPFVIGRRPLPFFAGMAALEA